MTIAAPSLLGGSKKAHPKRLVRMSSAAGGTLEQIKV
jgi:hypothetical protein